MDQYITVSCTSLTSYLINLIIDNVKYYKDKNGTYQLNFIDFDYGSGTLSYILYDEFKIIK